MSKRRSNSYWQDRVSIQNCTGDPQNRNSCLLKHLHILRVYLEAGFFQEPGILLLTNARQVLIPLPPFLSHIHNQISHHCLKAAGQKIGFKNVGHLFALSLELLTKKVNSLAFRCVTFKLVVVLN